MKYCLFLIVCLVSVAMADVGFQSDEGPIFNPLTNKNYFYLEYLPEGYDLAENTDREYPLLLFLHGSGETGNTIDDLGEVKRHGPPKLIENGHNMTFSVGTINDSFIVISPQQKNGSGGWPGTVLIPIVEYLLNNYRIDPDRVYMTGLSMGGRGSWQTVVSKQNVDGGNYFASIAPIAGGGLQNGWGTTAAEMNVRVWNFCGDNDPSVSLFGCRRAAVEMQSNQANPSPIITVYETNSHAVSWQNAYRTDNSLHNPNLYQWLLLSAQDDLIFANNFE
ncbi:hypothetical protein [Marinicella sp. W31]|uniref:carboxylesterase family protein n=1 Tax=Marinicella sp. W31 TaxID=3023713 RepID=UPI003757AB81